MKYIKFILLVIFFLINFKLLASELVNEIDDYKIIFIVDEKYEKIPDNILSEIKKTPIPEVDDAIIFYLVNENKYENIIVKKYLDKKTSKFVYLVNGSFINKIQTVILDGLNQFDQTFIQKNLNLQPGRIFSLSFINEDINKIQINMREKSYPNAVVKGYEVVPSGSGQINLIFKIEKGNACRIDQVVVENSNSNIFNFINLPIETGSLCDISSIDQKLLQIKTNYLAQGYLNAKAKIKDIEYSENKERAKLILTIDKGQKTIIQVKDENNSLINFDFLKADQNIINYSDIANASDSDLNSLMTNYYLELGYPYVKVEGPEKSLNSDQDLVLKFLVKKGNYVKIKHVYFIGELPESRSAVLDELQISDSIFSKDSPFIQSNIQIYRDKLRTIYLRNGFADAKIPLPDFRFSSDGTEANLIFNPIRGDKYILSSVNINNLPNNFKIKNRKLNNILKIGDIVTFDNKQSYLDEIKTQLLNEGYFYSQVKIKQDLTQTNQGIRFVKLDIEVTSGPLVSIGDISVQGDTFGKNESIISSSGLNAGGIFSQKALEEASSRILRHDLFSSVSIEPRDAQVFDRGENKIDIVIRVRGKSGYSLSLSPGWGSLKGYRFSTDYSLYNITSSGLRLISGASLSQERQQSSFDSSNTKQILGQQFNIGLTEPLFKFGEIYTPFDLSAVAGYQVAAETLTNREYETLKGILEWKPTFFGQDFSITSTLVHEKSISTSAESAVVQAIDSPSLVIREYMNTVSIDNRNNLAWPTFGSLFSFGFGMARFGLGSDVQYNRYIPKMNFYFPIYKKLSGALLIGGVFLSDTINKFGDTVTPPASRRATLTDDALIRGFPETYGSAAPGPLLWIHYNQNSLAPNCVTQLASVGGTNLTYIKAETRYRFSDLFGMVGFLDTGESFFSPKEVAQINSIIANQINPDAILRGQCTVDKASLIAPDTPDFDNNNFLKEYWHQAYVSTGIGFRFILGNVAAISLDYGYPLKDPSQHDGRCVTSSDAQLSNDAPACVSRFQESNYNFFGLYGFKFKGAVHFAIGAQF
jgi:outer membrane protein insertion porin family